MKKITLLTLLTMTVSLLITGCVNVNIEAPEAESTKGKEAKVFEVDDFDTEDVAEESYTPLAGYDVEYPGELGENDPITINLVDKFMKETGTGGDKIHMH